MKEPEKCGIDRILPWTIPATASVDIWLDRANCGVASRLRKKFESAWIGYIPFVAAAALAACPLLKVLTTQAEHHDNNRKRLAHGYS